MKNDRREVSNSKLDWFTRTPQPITRMTRSLGTIITAIFLTGCSSTLHKPAFVSIDVPDQKLVITQTGLEFAARAYLHEKHADIGSSPAQIFVQAGMSPVLATVNFERSDSFICIEIDRRGKVIRDYTMKKMK